MLEPSSANPVVLHFWATGCPECVEELGSLDAASRGCAETPVRILLVNVGEDEQEIRDFLAAHGVGLEVLRDPGGRVWRRVSGAGLPLNLTWDGSERQLALGPQDFLAWREALSALGCRY